MLKGRFGDRPSGKALILGLGGVDAGYVNRLRRMRVTSGNGHAYMAAGSALRIAAAQAGAAPELVGELTSEDGCYDIAVEGEYGYISGTDALSVVEVRDAGNPVLVGAAADPQEWGDEVLKRVKVAGSHVFALTGHRSDVAVVICDVSRPAEPHALATWAPSSKYVVDGNGDIAVVADRMYIASDGLWILDVSSATAPRLRGELRFSVESV